LNHLPLPIPSRHPSQRGFTLVELVVTVAVFAVLAALALPDFSETLRQWRRDSATRALSSDLLLARTESIKTSRRIAMCPSTNGTSCAASSDWRNGWIVFEDDGATDLAYDAGESVLKVVTAQAGIATLLSSGGVQFLQFLPNGLMSAGNTTFTVTPSGATAATMVNRVALSRIGRATVTTEHP
jgi:type IV fimbrial biogenesis protein FimT